MPIAHISLLKGRTKEQKAAMAEGITAAINKHSGAPRDAIIVVFHEVTQDDWATAGVLFSNKQAAKKT